MQYPHGFVLLCCFRNIHIFSPHIYQHSPNGIDIYVHVCVCGFVFVFACLLLMCMPFNATVFTNLTHTLRWRHNEHDGVSNHQSHHCVLHRLFRHRSKRTSKLRVTGLCAGNSPVAGEFPAQKTNDVENVSIWWRHHDSHLVFKALHWHFQESHSLIFVCVCLFTCF